jgi:ketosteroid isomerase-like protein
VLVVAYDAFNARDVESVLATMHPDVVWPNGMEGGHAHGHRGAREYWTRQWSVIDPRVEPLRYEIDDAGRIVVEVHQVVRDRSGSVMADRIVHHVYGLRDGLIKSFAGPLPQP